MRPLSEGRDEAWVWLVVSLRVRLAMAPFAVTAEAFKIVEMTVFESLYVHFLCSFVLTFSVIVNSSWVKG
jgi:hypothetical protein